MGTWDYPGRIEPAIEMASALDAKVPDRAGYAGVPSFADGDGTPITQRAAAV